MPHMIPLLSTLLVFQARILTQKYTLDLPVLVPEVECLIKVDLVAQFVGRGGDKLIKKRTSPEGSGYVRASLIGLSPRCD